MKLASQVAALKKQSLDLTLTERAELACHVAKQLEKAGEYEAACDALSEFWPERDSSPNLKGLDELTKARILTRVGALAGWLSSIAPTEVGQENAKNLITRSIEIFENLGDHLRLAEAHTDIAICYWREGSFDEARINLAKSLNLLGGENSEQRAVTLIWSGLVEVDAGRLHEALRLYHEAAPLIERTEDHAIKGAFHNEFGLVFRRLATPENREDYLDRALIEYAAASFHFEQANNRRYQARVENNLGSLFFTIGRYSDTHSHLDRARQLFLELKDTATAAQVDETRARVFLAEGHLKDARRVIRSSVKTLEKGDEQALLAETLTTYGVVEARLRNHARARDLLQRAFEIAQTAGDLEGAGRAQLCVIEELSAQTKIRELASIYESAADLLHRSQDPSTSERLIACARKLISAMAAVEENHGLAIEQDSWEGFSLRREITKIEKTVIERALRDAGGSVSKAAQLLGYKHHQSLISLIHGRHGDLIEQRSIVRKRRRHLFSKAKRGKPVGKQASKAATSKISILYVEGDPIVANVLDEMFGAQGWRVERATGGNGALEKLRSKEHYDLLLFDNDLPELSGLELVLRARSMPHRRRTPTILISENNCEAAAWRAGVDAFVRKPQDMDQLPEAIERLLKVKSSDK